MKKSAIFLSALMLLTSVVAMASTPPSNAPARAAALSPLAHGAHAVMTPVGGAPNTAYEQAVTAYLNNVLIEAQKHRAQVSSTAPARNTSMRSTGSEPALTHPLAVVDVANLPQVDAIMIGRRARARLMTASGGLLIVGVHDVTRYGTVTRIDSTGVWLRPTGLSHPILLEDLTPSEMAAASGSGGARAMGPYGGGESIATPPIPISPSPSRLPSGVRRY